MVQKLSYYKNLAEQMIKNDQRRDNAYAAYEAMDRCEWTLPAEVARLGWVKSVKSTDPHDAILAGVRVLASLDPRLKVQPVDTSPSGKKLANNWERNLIWQLSSVNRRRQGRVEKDIVRSALMYDEIVAQVVDLDYQVEGVKLLEGNTTRYKMARRFGRFIVNVFNPKFVHVRYSSAMPEAVVLCQRRKAREVMDEWGNAAKKLKEAAENDLDVDFYDYCDWEIRAVWVSNGKDDTEIVKPTEHGLPFLPWIAVIGGNTLEEDGEHKRQPMLYSIYTSGQWETQNIVKSLYVSEVIAHSAAPRAKEEGPNPDETDVNYGDPTRSAKVPPGNVYTPITPPMIDQALLEIDDRMSAAMDKSTVSRILLGETATSSSFASLNLVTQTAIGALKNAKDLAEKALSEIYTHMLLWVKESDKPLLAYGKDKKDLGMQYLITPDEIDPEGLYITVQMRPDVPTDQIAKMNAGVMGKQLGMSNETIMEELGITDPQEETKQFWYEKLFENFMQIQMTAMQTQVQMAQEQQAMQAQTEMQMQQEQAMMNQAQSPGIPAIGGQGFNPAMGGTPPAMAMPEATREEQTGAAMNGLPVADMAGF